MQVKVLGVLELSTLQAKVVEDPQGRKCIAMTIGEKDVCFTVTQALLIRQMLDAGINAMLKYQELAQGEER